MSADHLKAPTDFSHILTVSRVQERARLTEAQTKQLKIVVKIGYDYMMANAPWSQQSADSRTLFMAEVSTGSCSLS